MPLFNTDALDGGCFRIGRNCLFLIIMTLHATNLSQIVPSYLTFRKVFEKREKGRKM